MYDYQSCQLLSHSQDTDDEGTVFTVPLLNITLAQATSICLVRYFD